MLRFFSVPASPGKGRDRFLYAQNSHFRGQVWPFITRKQNNSGVQVKKDTLCDTSSADPSPCFETLFIYSLAWKAKVYLSSHTLGMLPDGFSAQLFVVQNALHLNLHFFPCLQQPFPSSSMAPVC